MFLLDEQFVFSPTDLTNAIQCEFAVLQRLDELLGWKDPHTPPDDPMLARTARLGDSFEARVLAQLQDRFGDYDPLAGRGMHVVQRPARGDPSGLLTAARQTADVLRSGADVVYQAAFLAGRFNGFADFLIRDRKTGSYAVYDTKLARHPKVTALLQLAAYADQLVRQQIPITSQVHLLLGDGSTFSQDAGDLLPIFAERWQRLEQLVDRHCDGGRPVRWHDDWFTACGRCDRCAEQVLSHRDVWSVAGIRTSQRSRLKLAGIDTIDQLADRVGPVAEVRDKTLSGLRAQAALQIKQLPPDGAQGPVVVDVFDPGALAVLPAPDAGDIFFDFEGDPLWSDGDLAVTGLEYLFGVLECDGPQSTFRAFWAHDRRSEQQALQDFLAYLVERRGRFPQLHVYHYAAYEKSALLRLAGRYGVGEEIVDSLLRDGVLVDLYPVVRNSVRVSQPSYSLKKLEPLYMGDELRAGLVTTAGDSIVAYADYCDLRDAGDSAAAADQLAEIADYNRYDCLSTYRLRDWLLSVAADHQVQRAGPPVIEAAATESEPDDLVRELLELAGEPAGRTPRQQAVAVLAAAVGYYRREEKPFWWAHFDRLLNPVAEWADTGDVLVVDEAAVISPWAKQGKQRNLRRTVRLAGRLGVGSQVKVGNDVYALYEAADIPDGMDGTAGYRGLSRSVEVTAVGTGSSGRDELIVVECLKSGVDPYDQLPMAITPGAPVRSENQRLAIVAEAEAVLAGSTVASASFELLCRHPPRVLGPGLPPVLDGDFAAAVTEAVRRLDRSYLAVQGPPGSGKTHVGARVITALVAQGWRIGVVAQSHKVVENMLLAVAAAGVGVDQIGKAAGKGGSPAAGRWTELGDKSQQGQRHADFLSAHQGTGCVVGGTAWDFTNRGRVSVDCLDLMVIDEAGQFCLANTIAVCTAAARLLLLGDPQQLPQVSQGTHPEPCDTSALAWLMQGAAVLPADRGYFLDRTWRMHPALTASVSRLAYADRLLSKAELTGARRLAGVRPGVHVVATDHGGNSVDSPQEADAVLTVVADLLGRQWSGPDIADGPRPLVGSDILVVAPFNAQVARLRNCLTAAGHGSVNVGTVDKFQGQQAAVVIVSMTASAPDDVPRGMDFLLSRNRVNVAISRGQWCAVIVRSPRLTDYLPSAPAGLGRLGAFIGLCETGAPWADGFTSPGPAG